MSKSFDLIAFDADDTLWHNEHLFRLTQEKFTEILSYYHSPKWISQRLYETEIKNLRLFGYGIKGFTLSMIETAIELTEGRIQGNEIQRIIELSKHMIKAPIELLPHVAEVLPELARRHKLMLITKGDLFDQESKIARSGLSGCFTFIEIVSEKNEELYRGILERYHISPDRFLMVGNSLKSDILPVVSAGARAVLIPYETTWQHEEVKPTEVERGKFVELSNMAALSDWLKDAG